MNGQQKISIPEELSTTWLFYTSGACVWLPLPSFSMYFHQQNEIRYLLKSNVVPSVLFGNGIMFEDRYFYKKSNKNVR